MDSLDLLLDKVAPKERTRKAAAPVGPLPAPVEVLPDEPGTFELEISDFSFLTTRIKNPPALRITVTWKFRHPKYGLLGISEQGWFVSRNSQGELSVSPPIQRYGPMQTQQLKTITAELHQLIVAMLMNNTTKAGVSYGGEVGKQWLEELRLKQPERYDPELPKEIKA